MKYYLRKEGIFENKGPFSLQKIKEKLEAGKITNEYLVRDSSLETDWFKISSLLEYENKEEELLKKYNKQNYKYEEKRIVNNEAAAETKEFPHQITTNATAPYQFKTLLGYGKFISGLGWIVIIIGIIAIIGGFASGSEVGVGVAVGSLIFIILGIGMVASGQLISCFVSIERNTRATYELLKQNQK